MLTINDCIYDGTLTAGTNKTGSSGFVVYSWAGITNISNSLLTATFANGMGSSDCATFVRNKTGNISNSYFLNALGTIQGNQITADELANGKVAFYLQNGRSDLFWGQAIGVDPQPVLTNDESKRVYRSADGYTNNPAEAIEDQSIVPLLYTRNSNNELTITGFDPGFTPPANYRLVIPDDIDGAPVVAIAEAAFRQKTNFTSLYIGKNVTSIGTNAFRQCTALTAVIIPKSVTAMGTSIFEDCTGLTSAAFEDGFTMNYIPDWTFYNTLFTSFTIPASVQTINKGVFSNNTALAAIDFPATVTKLGEEAFRNCSALSAVTIPATITAMDKNVFWNSGVETADVSCAVLGQGAFYQCAKLESVTLNEGVTNIGLGAFHGCTKLPAVTIPSTVTVLQENAFRECTLLGTVNFTEGSQLTTIGPTAFYVDTALPDIDIPATVTTIGNSAFRNCSKLVTVNIPANTQLTTIGSYAFADRALLPSFTIPNTVTTLADRAFYNCPKLQTVTFSNQLTAIQDETFRKCTLLDNVTIPKSVTHLGSGAFRECTSLVSIVIPNTITTMGTSLFEDCTGLTSVTYEDGFTMNYIPDWTFYNTRFTSFTIPASVQTINKGVFSNNTALAAIDFPATVTKLGEEAFRNCSALSAVTIPATITAMDKNVFWNSGVETADVSCAVLGQGAFYQCAKLESVTLNEGVTNIGLGAFHGCTKLPAVTIPSTVTVLQENAFRECTLLGTVNFTEGSQLTTIGPTAFYVDTALPDIDIPATVTTIGNSAFRNCSKLVTVNIPANTQLTTIGSYAFADRALLPSFTIPNTVTTLADRAFYNCPKLQTVTFSNQLTAIQDETFRKCTLLDNVTIPKSVTHLGSGAFRECTSLVSIVIPNTITTMGTSLFEDCTGLTSVTYEDGFTMNYIPDWTFYNTRFTSFTIPASVQTINRGAFSCNTALAAIDFPATVTKLGEEAFRNCSALSAVTIPATITAMDRNVFWNSGVETADVSCAVLAQGAFYQCAKLESVTLNEGVTTIGVGAFHGCSILPEVTIPKTVTVLSENAFRECPLLETVTFENGIQLESIGNHAFRSCAKLNNVVLPGSLRLVGEWAFSYCTALENLTVEEGVAVISRDAFQYSGMKNVVLPSTLDFIGVNLFYQCNQLETLDLSKCVNVWELYSYTALRGGSYNITYGVPATTKIIMPPYTQATLGANDEVATIDFNLTKDEEDYYLIDTADDWDKFVAYSRAYPNVNGRITADLDLTTHQGKLGVGNGESNYITYQGTLDGQGHTLTISYKNGKEFTGGLLAYVENATVKNLHVQGAVNVYYRVIGGIVGFVKPGATLTMQDCESNIDFTVTPTTTNMHVAGFIGQGKTGIVTFADCLYNGTITGVSSFRYAAPFMGWMESAGRITYNDCLNNGTFVNTDKNYTYALGATQNNGQSTAAVCYFKAGNITNNESLATAATAEQLASGMITYRLQGSREEQHWGQKIGTDPAPRLTNEDGTRVYRGQTYTNEYVEYAGLQKDADDYYLIAGTADWEEFCLLIEDFPLSNARMTADVEVADNSLIGTSTMPYSGIFDGQGHTLTVNYTSMDNYCAPFNYINGATIQNLHTTGQITIGGRFGGGIVASSKGTSTMQNCWSSVNIVSSFNGDATHGGLVAYQENGDLTINNCLFDGSIVGEQSYRCGGLVGYRNATLTLSNSLCVPTSIMVNEYDCGTLIRNGGGTVTNCYFTQSLNNRDQGTHVTDEQLASGYVTYKLQNKSDELVWAQNIGTDEHPQLVVFNPTALRVYRALEGFSNDPDQAALSQDTDGYYLIGTVNDWKMLAMLVEDDEVDAKARMTADIDLGDDQTMIGSGIINDNNAIGVICYQGIFDGQGHTLTVNYTATENVVAPFRYIKDATIKNLRVRGTIATAYKNAGGIVGYCVGQQIHSYIVNCISSVDIISSFVNNSDAFYDASHHGGIISGILYYGQLHIDDCIFNGSISGETKGVTWGGMVGFPDGTVTLTNCLQMGTFDCSGVTSGSNGSGTFATLFGNGYASRVEVVNSYYLNQLGNAQGTKATAETLADGTVTTALQAGRAEEVWTQYASMPMLKLFAAAYIPGDANGDGEVNMSDAVAIVNYILGNPSQSFNFNAADVNGDGKVTISDAVGVVNMSVIDN